MSPLDATCTFTVNIGGRANVVKSPYARDLLSTAELYTVSCLYLSSIHRDTHTSVVRGVAAVLITNGQPIGAEVVAGLVLTDSVSCADGGGENNEESRELHD